MKRPLDSGEARAAEHAGDDPLVEAIRAVGVTDERLIAAIAALPRERFVPSHATEYAYLDRPIPISHDQVTTQPSLIARMVEALELTGDEKVLEVGGGYGYQTALLARLARAVWSVERWPDMVETARANLAKQSIENVHLVLGDGTEGLPAEAPFDATVVAAAFPSVSPPLADQLAPGGRLVQPIGPGGHEDVILFEKRGDELVAVRSIVPAHFVPLYGRHGYAEEGA